MKKVIEEPIWISRSEAGSTASNREWNVHPLVEEGHQDARLRARRCFLADVERAIQPPAAAA